MNLSKYLIGMMSVFALIGCGGSGGSAGEDITDISNGQVIFSQQVSNHQVFMAADGNGVAVWKTNNDGANSIWSSTYTASSDSWSTAVEIANYDSAIVYRTAASDNGVVHVIWKQSNPAIDFNILDVIKDQIWANHYRPGIGWSGAAKIADLEYSATDVSILGVPKVAINNNDQALLVWKQVDDTGVGESIKSLYSMSFDFVTGWKDKSLIDSDVLENLENFYELSMNDSGDAILAWSDEAPTGSTKKFILYSFYSAATGWSLYDFIEVDPDDDINNFNTVKLQLFQNGNVVALWSYLNSSATNNISTARQYNATSMTWADAYPVTPNITTANRALDLEFNREGEGFYLFTEFLTGGIFPLRARLFTFESDFNSAQTPTDSTGALNLLRASIDIDDSANAIALWAYDRPDGDGNGLRARRYDPLGGWTEITNFGRFMNDGNFTLDMIPDGSGDSAMALHITSERFDDYELIATKIDYNEE